MAVTFYDDQDPHEIAGVVHVERVYCLDWQRFADPDWSALDRIYRTLPGWLGYLEVAHWFGSDDQATPHLFASVEPSGLCICGVLATTDWLDWVRQFEAAILGLPSFEVD